MTIFALLLAVQTLSLAPPSGVEILQQASATPDANGVIHRYTLDLPAYDAATYWAPHPGVVRPIPFRDPAKLPEGGFFLLLKQRDGVYTALLALTGNATMAWLVPKNGGLALHIGTYGTARVTGPFPAAAWARAADPYTACREVWRIAAGTGNFRLREQKQLPEFLHYLGFATWEEYRENYDAAKLVDMMNRIHASGVPLRWIQIGKGHHDFKFSGKTELLNSFEPHPQKFPNGWGPVMAARKPDGIKWLGVFQALSGYPQGIYPENALGELNRALMPVPSGVLQPRIDPASAAAFYDAMLAAVARRGFDFIKMDFQANNLRLYRGTANAVEAAVNNQRAFQTAAAKYLHGHINCMAHYTPGIFNTADSVMSRVAQDYKKGNAANARSLLYNCYGNLPWAGQTVWGDHDMFHSSDAISAKMMAVAKAMSGGTIYLSDAVDRFNKELIAPLCYKDGRILRPLAPAAPLPESLFINPATEPFRVVAPLPNGDAAVVVYNLADKDLPAFTAPGDYANASVLMQPYPGAWPTPKEGILAYDWRERKARRLNERWDFAMPAFTDRFLLLCPIEHGWSVIGRTDKYLSPAGVEIVSRTAATLVLRLPEPGPVTLWTSRGKPSSKGVNFQPAGDGLWTAATLPAGEVRIAR